MENPGCNTGTVEIIPADDWMEMEVIMGFRVWQLMFLALAGLITVVVLLCCFMKCRVPRTKQEIEADFKRKEITRRFRFLLDRVPIEDTSLRTAIEKVSELYSDREKMKKRKKKKTEDEEEIISMGSSYLFEDEKLTLIGRIKKMVGLLKEDEGDSDDDSLKDKSEKSEDLIKRASDDDDLSSLPNVHKVSIVSKSRQQSEESKESSDSPQIDSHSKLSLIPDSPVKIHETLSKLSLLQDSPPKNGLSLLQDTPPHKRKLSKEESGTVTSDSQDSKKKPESQDSHDSEQSKKQDSIISEKSPRPKLSFIESTKGRVKTSISDSQDSDDSQLVRHKSDSQDSNDSEKSKNKKLFEPKESKLTRRESTAGHGAQNIINKWGQKPSSGGNSKSSKKGSKSLDVNQPY